MTAQRGKLYPDSGVELNPFLASYYDVIINIATLGIYHRFIHRAINKMNIQPRDAILDLGCGTGRNACIMKRYLGHEGRITGIDLSPVMERQFKKKCREPFITFARRRIDLPFSLSERFDKVFISFVIHGFPHKVRQTILANVYNQLKPGGLFFILDFAEFDINEMPFFERFIFKSIECTYAFDFIERDWKQILAGYHFSRFEESFYIKKYVRLLQAEKPL